jgi:hypothetical protein
VTSCPNELNDPRNISENLRIHLSAVVKAILNSILHRSVKNSDLSDLAIDLDEGNEGVYTLEIKSKAIYTGERQLIRRRGRNWTMIVFVASVVAMIVFIVPGMLIPDATTGRSLVYIGLWPSIVANTLGARLMIKRIMTP